MTAKVANNIPRHQGTGPKNVNFSPKPAVYTVAPITTEKHSANDSSTITGSVLVEMYDTIILSDMVKINSKI